jgi:glutamyl-tRNA synthetase
MRELSLDELTQRLEEHTGHTGLGPAVAISHEKIQTLADFWPLAGFMFDGPADDPGRAREVLDEDGRRRAVEARDALAALDEWDGEPSSRRCAGRRGARRQAARRLPAGPRRAGRDDRLPGHLRDARVLGRDESLRASTPRSRT